MDPLIVIDYDSGQDVPKADPALINAYAAQFKSSAERDLIFRIFAWLHTFSDPDGHPMTEGDIIGPLFRQALKGDTFAVLACSIIWNHNQETWLWNRMTFHALAGIQGRVSGNSELLTFAKSINPFQTLTPVN